MFQSTLRVLHKITPLNRRSIAACIAFVFVVMGSQSAHSQCPNSNWTICSPSFDLRITVSNSHAGAITSLTYGGVEIVNNYDHGRQIQTSLSLNGKYEGYNPNEAGTLDDSDYPWSTSELLGLSIPSSNRVMTTTDMAYWWVKTSAGLNEKQKNNTIPYANAAPDGHPTQFGMQKDVTIGPPGLPGNVIEYLNTFQPSATNPPEAVTSNDGTVSAWLTPNFTEVYSYDLATRQFLQNQYPGGADDMVKVLRWPNVFCTNNPACDLMFAIYSPENLQTWEGSGFSWALPALYGNTTAILTDNVTTDPLPQSYRTYFAVGNWDAVQNGLDSLDVRFASMDPDVFIWHEYLALNPDLWPYIQGDPRRWLRNHWLSNGVAEGRPGSYHFSAARYRDLNSDRWGQSYQDVITHYIQYGRKEGRSTAPRPQGGIQHTIVRSPQPDFVPVRASGGNYNGQLGNGTTTTTAWPVQLGHFGGENRVTDVAAGAYTSLAVLSNGTVWMWGSNQYGARGDGSVGGQYNSPVQVPYLPAVVVPSTKDRNVVAANLSAYAVLDNEGKVWTWGAGWNGQLGSGNTSNRYTPGKVQKHSDYGGGDLTGIVSISVGQSQMVALDIDEHVWTWGSNQYGVLGNGLSGDSYVARKVVAFSPTGGELPGIVKVVAGGSSFCLALDRAGNVYGWGNNGSGQIGDYTTTSKNYASGVYIPRDNNPAHGQFVDDIAAGAYHGLARRSDGAVYGWGYNGWGQLGTSSAVNQLNPVRMDETNGMAGVTEVAAGSYFSLMLRSDRWGNWIWGVGDNQSGQLGDGSYTQRNQPVLTNF